MDDFDQKIGSGPFRPGSGANNDRHGEPLPRRHLIPRTVSPPLRNRREVLTGLSSLALAVTLGCGRGGRTTVSPLPTTPRLPAVLDHRITRWGQDPWARGSYSYLGPGASSATRRMLALPIDGHLFFAGEATDTEHPATVHGALASG